MGGVCERPGCSRPGAAAVAADARNLTVWIGDLETSDASVNTLCALHADNLAVPVGWVCRDVRDAPRLFAVRPTPPSTDATPPAARRKRAARRKAGAVASQRLDHTEQDAGAGGDATATDPAGGSPASAEVPAAAPPPANLGDLHRGDAQLSEATAGLLRAGTTTPLLARAFRTARTARAAG